MGQEKARGEELKPCNHLGRKVSKITHPPHSGNLDLNVKKQGRNFFSFLEDAWETDTTIKLNQNCPANSKFPFSFYVGNQPEGPSN